MNFRAQESWPQESEHMYVAIKYHDDGAEIIVHTSEMREERLKITEPFIHDLRISLREHRDCVIPAEPAEIQTDRRNKPH